MRKLFGTDGIRGVAGDFPLESGASPGPGHEGLDRILH